MIDIELNKKIRNSFPYLNQNELVQAIVKKGIKMTIPSNQTIVEVGATIKVVPLVLEGAIKVVREDNSDKEVFLYYITGGQSCAMTLTSCMKREKSLIRAVTLKETTLIALPVEELYYFTKKFPVWTDFVLATYSKRFDELLAVIDSVCFQNMDARLTSYLCRQSELNNSTMLTVSHAQIAEDLGTRREVISRLLKQMERNNYVQLYRGRIKLSNLLLV